MSETSHPIGAQSAPSSRPCSWCAAHIRIERRPGRPRLYCNHACRQRAYEHRHGFLHRRTVRPLPGQEAGDSWSGTGYERGGFGLVRSKVHAMRTSVRPEGRRRETLCGLLVAPVTGQHFSPLHRSACATCSSVADRSPLTHGISSSNELSRLRAVIDDIAEQRVPAASALGWLRADAPRVQTSSGALTSAATIGTSGTGGDGTNTLAR
jgi:hypothetical protein